MEVNGAYYYKLVQLTNLNNTLARTVDNFVREVLPKLKREGLSDEELADQLLNHLKFTPMQHFDFDCPEFDLLLSIKEVFDAALVKISDSPLSPETVSPAGTQEPTISVDVWIEESIGPMDLTKDHAFTKGFLAWLRDSKAEFIPQEEGRLHLDKLCTAKGTIMRIPVTLEVQDLTIRQEGGVLTLKGLSINGYKGLIKLRCERARDGTVQFLLVEPQLHWVVGWWLGTFSLEGLMDILNNLKWGSSGK